MYFQNCSHAERGTSFVHRFLALQPVMENMYEAFTGNTRWQIQSEANSRGHYELTKAKKDNLQSNNKLSSLMTQIRYTTGHIYAIWFTDSFICLMVLPEIS